MVLPTIIRDTREKSGHGWRFNKSKEITGTIEKKLDYGDYAIEGFENDFVIERKGSAGELIGNLFSADKDRFLRELEKLSSFKFACVICEFDLADVAGQVAMINRSGKKSWGRRTFITMAKFLGYIASLTLQYKVQFIFAGKEGYAKDLGKKLLLKAHKYNV